MDEIAIGSERARELGRTVARHSHDDLETATIEDVLALTESVEAALEAGATETAADRLLDFWGGQVGTKLGLDEEALTPAQLPEHFERAFQADALGVDLYQALSKTATAPENDFDHHGWTERLLELTNRHVAHLESHLES
mgnify:CR=1 FL=1